ncbi:MAG: hypothetical protein ACPG51_10360 [Thiolinea sp.]
MRPADLILLIRQRSEWEAVDLGFTLMQTVWRQLFPAWALLLLSFAAISLLLIPEDYVWVAGVLLWWIKPFFDRVILHILSRNLFNQTLSIADVFSALPGLVRNTGLLGALTWRRLSFSRSYNLPIWQLEQLRGDRRKKRHELLYQQGHGAAVALTVACILLQSIIALSIYALVIAFDPSGQAWEHLKGLFTGSNGSDMEYLLSLGDFTTQVIAILFIEPFFVAAGFTLYLNRRTQLEAWDIEITFRSLGERLEESAEKAAHTILAVCAGIAISLLITLSPNQVLAAEDEYLNPERLPVSESSRQLEQVMQTEELNDRRQISTWVPRDKSKPEDQPKLGEELIQLISAVFKYLLWALVLAMLVLGFVYRHKIIALLKPPAQKNTPPQQPAVLFGLDIRPESLPEDIAAEAKQLWQQGKARESLSLLYRGALAQLTRQDELIIEDSHTEGDILRLARPGLETSRFEYLRRITRCWQAIAYAHRAPDTHEMEPLFSGWSSFRQTPVPVETAAQTSKPEIGQPSTDVKEQQP